MERSFTLTEQQWDKIDTVLLDMDGTLLDLAFDNHFWLSLIPKYFAKQHDLTSQQAEKLLKNLYDNHHGTLNWYCTDFWAKELQLDIIAIKQKHAEQVAFRPGSIDFLQLCKQHSKKLYLVTNAHPDTLSIKLQQKPFAHYFDELLSSHQLGFPKENLRFWQLIKQRWSLDFDNTLFVDDSLPILQMASQASVAYVCGINQPDLRQAANLDLPYWNVNQLTEIVTK